MSEKAKIVCQVLLDNISSMTFLIQAFLKL